MVTSQTISPRIKILESMIVTPAETHVHSVLGHAMGTRKHSMAPTMTKILRNTKGTSFLNPSIIYFLRL